MKLSILVALGLDNPNISVTKTRTLDCQVGIQDINNDGYGDLIVGALGYNSSAGRLYIFYGANSGITSKNASAADIILTGVETSGFFGKEFGSGDINGDGYVDLVVSARGYNSNQGRIYVFHGSGTGFVSDTASSANTFITGPNPSQLGAETIVLGDVNNDGYDDISVGGLNYSSYTGIAYIFNGSASGIATTDLSSGGIASTTITAEAGGRFGSTELLGDINNDGYLDLLVNAYYYSGAIGKSYIFNGSASGISDIGGASADTMLTGENVSYFGFHSKFGDYNNDGYLDLIAPATGYPSNAMQGRVYLFNGSSSGISTVDLSGGGSADFTITGETNSSFGRHTAMTDVNGDGYLDLIMGGYLYNSSQGRAYVFFGSSSGFSVTDAASADIIITGESVGDNFGRSVSR